MKRRPALAEPETSLFKDLRDNMLRLTERFAGHLVGVADIAWAWVFLFGVLLFAPGRVAPKTAEPAPADLKPDTVAAFNEYLKLTDARNENELQRGANLLWSDGLPEEERPQAYEARKRG